MAILTAFLDYEPIDIPISDLLDLSALSIEMAEKPVDMTTPNINGKEDNPFSWRK